MKQSDNTYRIHRWYSSVTPKNVLCWIPLFLLEIIIVDPEDMDSYAWRYWSGTMTLLAVSWTTIVGVPIVLEKYTATPLWGLVLISAALYVLAASIYWIRDNPNAYRN